MRSLCTNILCNRRRSSAFALALAAALLASGSPLRGQQAAPQAGRPTLEHPTLQQNSQQPAPPDAQTNARKTDAPAGTPAIAVKVKEVNLLAVVRDKKGQAVANLGKQDFVLEQDGRPQAITQLAPQSDLPLTVGVLAETGAGQRKALAGERKAGTDFLNRLLREHDRGFVLHFDREVELLQDVTSSHDKLAKGIDQLAAGPQAGSPGEATPGRHGRGRRGDETEPGEHRFSFGGEVLYDAIFLSAEEVLRDQTGRKAIVLFSDGVDRASKTTLQRAIESAQRAETVVYCVFVAPERDEWENGNDHAGRGSYPGGNPGGGYPGGGYPQPFPGGGYPRYPGGGYPGGGPVPGGGRREPENVPRENKNEGKKILQQIADETGGRYFELSKKMSAAQIYEQVADEMRHQYSLSYTPDAAGGGFHKLRVSTRNPELTVHTRSGFYAD